MENKKYLDKVIGSLLRSTKMDYDKEGIIWSFDDSIHPFFTLHHFLDWPPPLFTYYCKDQFGLTEEEMVYVWKEYVDIINGKIENEG